MHAEILPLDKKYYGTEIKVRFDDGKSEIFQIWLQGDYTPSEREPEDMDICDNHYETQFCYEVCKMIVKAINEGQLDNYMNRSRGR